MVTQRQRILKESIWFLGIKSTILNLLFSNEIKTVGDLIAFTHDELLKLNGMTDKMLWRIEQALEFWGMYLAEPRNKVVTRQEPCKCQDKSSDNVRTCPEPCRCIDTVPDDVEASFSYQKDVCPNTMVVNMEGIEKYRNKHNIMRCLKNLYKGIDYFIVKNEFDECVVLIDVLHETWGSVRNYKFER
jgi:hypothetical protein